MQDKQNKVILAPKNDLLSLRHILQKVRSRSAVRGEKYSGFVSLEESNIYDHTLPTALH